MIGHCPLLSPEYCDQLVRSLEKYKWRTGATPNQTYSERIKRNAEIYTSDDGFVVEQLRHIGTKIIASRFFANRVFPKHVGSARFNRYSNGGSYEKHTDSAFMGNNPEIRTDISITVFLTDGYDGGELTLHWHDGNTSTIKEPKGTLVFYPTGIIHNVEPVVEGERIAWVGWAESHVRDREKRELLSEVSLLSDDIAKVENLGPLHTRMINVKHKLWRRWLWT